MLERECYTGAPKSSTEVANQDCNDAKHPKAMCSSFILDLVPEMKIAVLGKISGSSIIESDK